MSQGKPTLDLDRLAELAREDEPPELEAEQALSMIQGAMERAGHDRRQQRRRSRILTFAAAAAVIPLLIGVGLLWGGWEAGETTQLRATLPTGDRLVAISGAQFEVESAAEEHRQVSLDQGVVLFDVQPLEDEERFEVVTDQLRVLVRGTVFSVDAGEQETVVRVYEGRVEVVQGEDRQIIDARRMWGSRHQAIVRIDDADPLAEEGREAARRREALATNEPTPEPAPEPEPEPLVEQQLETTQEQGVASDTPLTTEESETMTDVLSQGRALPPAGGRPEKMTSGVTLRAQPPEPPRPRPRQPSDEETQGNETPASESEESHDVPEERVPSPAEARRMLLGGEADAVLALARAHNGGAWRLLEADALRALRRYGEAGSAYDRAADSLTGPGAAQAGYLAASTKLRAGDANGALSSLERSGAASPGSPLAERATALRVRLLNQVGRRTEARRAAEQYLERYPGGGMSGWMRSLVDGAGPVESSSDHETDGASPTSD